MSYSKNTKVNKIMKRVLLLCIISLLIGLIAGYAISRTVYTSEPTVESEVVQHTQKVQKVEPEPNTMELSPEELLDISASNLSVVEDECLGEYTITAYCSCEKCCGKWAKNRKDGIVKGALGVELKEGISIASPLEFNTRVNIDGLGEYIVQDKTAKWIADKYNNKIIDIYFSNHSEALKFGKQHKKVSIVK